MQPPVGLRPQVLLHRFIEFAFNLFDQSAKPGLATEGRIHRPQSLFLPPHLRRADAGFLVVVDKGVSFPASRLTIHGAIDGAVRLRASGTGQVVGYGDSRPRPCGSVIRAVGETKLTRERAHA